MSCAGTRTIKMDGVMLTAEAYRLLCRCWENANAYLNKSFTFVVLECAESLETFQSLIDYVQAFGSLVMHRVGDLVQCISSIDLIKPGAYIVQID